MINQGQCAYHGKMDVTVTRVGHEALTVVADGVVVTKEGMLCVESEEQGRVALIAPGHWTGVVALKIKEASE